MEKSEMPRQHYPFLRKGLENQGFASEGMRFYARFMPEVKVGVVAWLKIMTLGK